MADTIISINSGFYDAIDNDRTYTADDMGKPYNLLLQDGIVREILSTTAFNVTGDTGMRIVVFDGRAILGGKWVESLTPVYFDVPANTSVYNRLDSVIIQVDKRSNGRVANLVYRTGTPASQPQLPEINTIPDVIEMRLGYLTITPGMTEITSSTITDWRGTPSCPWVKIKAEYQTTVSVQMYTSQYTTNASTTTVPIGISQYDSATDFLLVFINGLLALGKYTAGASNITLSEALPAGNTVSFIVLHVAAS